MGHERREVWAKRVERWADSGLTAHEFAAEIGVNANTLAHWRWRLNARTAARPRSAARSTAPAFVEVVEAAGVVGAAPAAAAVTEPLELVLPSGLRIRVPVHFDAASLRSLVAALEAR
jgi:transposase-like protein